jgi:hypothetical protein
VALEGRVTAVSVMGIAASIEVGRLQAERVTRGVIDTDFRTSDRDSDVPFAITDEVSQPPYKVAERNAPAPKGEPAADVDPIAVRGKSSDWSEHPNDARGSFAPVSDSAASRTQFDSGVVQTAPVGPPTPPQSERTDMAAIASSPSDSTGSEPLSFRPPKPPEPPPPQVQSVTVNGPGVPNQRSMVTSLTVTFNTLVNISVGAFTIFPQRGGTVTVIPSQSDSSGRSVVTLTFASDQDLESTSLADGNYTLKILGVDVRDRRTGAILDGDGDGKPGGNYRFTFYRLFGDVNGDRTVDNTDATAFQAAFGSTTSSPQYRPEFDADHNGAIDASDRQRFQQNNTITLADFPPVATSLAWFDWYDQTLQQRLDAVPLERATTYYFAQSGNDLTGDGSEARPWKSLAKAAAVLAAAPQTADLRLRFHDGDVWREATTLTITNDRVTIDDYGDGAKPDFTRFVQQYTGGWQLVSGTLYRRAEPMNVGWVRPAADPFGRLLQRTDASTSCGATVNSWCYDATAQVLYVNLGSDPNALPGGLEACPGDGQGWLINGDNVRLQNIRLEGVGMSRAGTGYGLQIFQTTGWEQAVCVGVDSLFTGYHSIGQTNHQGGLATFVDCVGGYCNPRGGETVFVSYADFGGNQAIWEDCQARFGTLPAEGFGQSVIGIYAHTAGAWSPGLLIANGFENPTNMVGALLTGPPADTLSEVLSFVVGANGGFDYLGWGATAYMNDTYTFRNSPYTYTQTLFTLTSTGWCLNCTVSYDAANQPYAFGLYQLNDPPYLLSAKFVNCQFDIINANNIRTTLLYTYNDPQAAAGGLFENCIFTFTGSGSRGLNLPNNSTVLRNNAYLLSGNQDFTADRGAIDLRTIGRIVPGTALSPDSPLWDSGASGPYVLEYDRYLTPRGDIHSIGPVMGRVVKAEK